VVYRGYEGVAREDRLLDDNREDWEKGYPFVPICRGVTFFQIQACRGDELLDQWPASPPPPGVRITISFGTPHEVVRGGYDVADSDKISRIVAIDPTRKIKFAAVAGPDANAPADPNAPAPDTSGKKPSNQRSTGGSPSKQPSAAKRTTNEQTPTQRKSR
jgi:hypothetical protein